MSDIVRRLRLSNGVMLDAEREECADEIERLREELDRAERIASLTVAASSVAGEAVRKMDEANAEIERLQERIREAAKLNMRLMEIRDDLDLDWNRLRSGDQRALIADHQDVFNMMFDLQAEIERLRGLLRECDCALGWQGHNGSCLDQSFNDYDPDCPECKLLMRVREALGE